MEEHDGNPVHWSGVTLDDMASDLAEPIPTERPYNNVQKVTALIQWMCFFLTYWQLACRISDNGLEWLLCFYFRFLEVINCQVDSVFLRELLVVFPTSMYMVRKLISLDRDNFTKYIACPKCKHLYTMEQCTRRNCRGETVAVTCSNKIFYRRGTVICGSRLVKEVVVKNGSKLSKHFYPLKVYCFYSIINQLEQLLRRPGFPQLCESWRQRETKEDVLYDVFDGDVWKSFKWIDGSLFFSEERRYGLMMNIDWFQPFKRRTDYSVGVIYFVLMNLPRRERFKFENIIIAGIIPPFDKEPCLNTFLEPVIDELRILWKGLKLSNSLSSGVLTFVAALLCVAADVPAARKACGFKSHAANKGCSKCLKNFPGGFGEKKDYSGFNRLAWPRRSKASHNAHSRKLKNSSCKSEYDELSKKYGINYSVLTTLDYFDAVRFHVIDPMHNLFLGIAKKTWKIWKENMFNKQQLADIDRKIKEMNVGSDVGRVGSKISANYGTFTAQEWKNWTIVHSMFVLDGILPANHLQLWERFVLACRILCQPVVSMADIKKADVLLLNFCKGYAQLYGKYAITPNLHLCCHLQESMFDYGPIYAFWLFSFERYNGELGANITNNRSVEIQYMRKFITSAHVHPKNSNVPFLYKDEFEELFSRNSASTNVSLSDKTLSIYYSSTTKDWNSVFWNYNSHITLSNEFVEDALDTEDLGYLHKVYSMMFPTQQITKDSLPHIINKHKHIHIGDQKFGSMTGLRSKQSSHILAYWINEDNRIDLMNATLHLGIVSYYFTHKIDIGQGRMNMYTFAVVKWNRKAASGTSSTRQLWMNSDFIIGGCCSFLPVQRIHCRAAVALLKNKYLMVAPLTRKVCV